MTHPHPVPLTVSPVGRWDRIAIIILGGAGCALSYDALQQMAVAIHVRSFLTYLFPLVIDGFIAYGVRALLVLSTAPLRARAYVWLLFGTATTASIWANALHAVRLNEQTARTGLRLGDTVVAVLSTLAPLALAGAVHLYILITRHHPSDRSRMSHGSDHPSPRTAVRTGKRAHSRTAPEMEQRTNRSADQAVGPRTEACGPPDEDGTDQQTGPGADQTAGEPQTGISADHAATDRVEIPGPPQGDGAGGRTSAEADQTPGPPRTRITAVHLPDASAGSAQDLDQISMVRRSESIAEPEADRPRAASPTDQEQVQVQRRIADDQTQSPGQRTDRSADQPASGRSAGPAKQRTADRDAPSTGQSRTRSTDQNSASENESVPMDRLVEIARNGALREGRMTRRAIRPYLRARDIKISNERFGELQGHLYQDEALQHLPRSRKKSR